MDEIEVKRTVREAYSIIVKTHSGCGCTSCGPDNATFAKSIGYSEEQLAAAPEGANLALSCGNPSSLAGLKEGEVVLDLGSGAGFDCFVAAPLVGPSGRIIDVDMTPEMLEAARENAKKGAFPNVEFRLGEIENLPVADSSVDVVMSNCVINLSADKKRVFQEVLRVLKPGGRVAISDMALLKELPEKIRQSIEAYIGCVAGAIHVDEYRRLVEDSGLRNVRVTIKGSSSCIDAATKDPLGRAFVDRLDEGQSLQDYVASVYVEGRK